MVQLIKESLEKRAVGNVPVPLTGKWFPNDALRMRKDYVWEREEKFTVSGVGGGTGYTKWLILESSQMDFQ